MIIGFTGTRRGMTPEQESDTEYWLARLEFRAQEFHFGDCIGADQQAAKLARKLGYSLHCHPPDNDRFRAFVKSDVLYEARPYLARNHDIVIASTLLIAAPGSQTEQRSGTWATIRYAKRSGRRFIILPSRAPGCGFRLEQDGN